MKRLRFPTVNPFLFLLLFVLLSLELQSGVACSTNKNDAPAASSKVSQAESSPSSDVSAVLTTTLPEIPNLKALSADQLGVDAMLTQLSQVDAWQIAEPAKIYDRETLSDLINGSAEAYVALDFKNLLYLPQVQFHKVVLTAYLFDMGTDVSAFGIYSSEKPFEMESATISQGGYWQKEELVFWNGCFYFKIRFHPNNTMGISHSRHVLEQFATAIKRLMPDSVSPIESIRQIFPPNFQKSNVFTYQSDGFEGIDFITRVFRMMYSMDNKEIKAFVSFQPTKKDCEALVAKYKQFVTTEKCGLSLDVRGITPSLPVMAFDCTYFHGKQFFLVGDDKVFGIFGDLTTPQALEILQQMNDRSKGVTYASVYAKPHS